MRAGAGRLWGKVKNVESLLSARKLQEEADILQEWVHSARISLSCWRAAPVDEHFEHLKYLIKNGVNAIMPRV